MPLYLDEIWIKDPTNPAQVKEFVGMLSQVSKDPASVGVPSEVRIVAGPWASNEEAKIVMVIDIPDHTRTFQIFGTTVARGLVEKRRLAPLVEWSELETLAGSL